MSANLEQLLAGLEALEAMATPGPWRVMEFDAADWGEEFTQERCNGIESVGNAGSPDICRTDSGVYPPEIPDARLIVALRNAFPALSKGLREAWQERNRALEAEDRIRGGPGYDNGMHCNHGVLTCDPCIDRLGREKRQLQADLGQARAELLESRMEVSRILAECALAAQPKGEKP